MTWPTDNDNKLGEYDAMELPGQQLSSTHAKSMLDYHVNLDIKAAEGCQRLTGILASLGSSTNNVDIMEKMMAAGMNIACMNMSFGRREEHVETIKMLRQACKKFSSATGKNYPLAIAMRLSGRKIRTGQISENYGESIELKRGDIIRLTADERYRFRCSIYVVFVDYLYLPEQLKRGDTVYIDNQALELTVELISPTILTCIVERGGLLGSYKNVFIPNVILRMPSYTEKDRLDVEMAIDNEVDIIMVPYVNGPKNITEMRNLVKYSDKEITLVAVISTIEGYRNFEDILRVTDGVMITRQELGADMTSYKLVIAQKNMITRANRANIPVIISTQLLSSMLTSKFPHRTEIHDIGICILDGADCLGLCSETAIGMYPVESIACLDSACKEAEVSIWTNKLITDAINKSRLRSDQATCTAMAGVLAAQRIIAAAIIVVTTSGKSAEIVAKFHPRCPIIAVTRHPDAAKRLHLWRGIIPLIYEDFPEFEWSQDLDKRVNFAVQWAMERGFVRVGDPIIIVSGWKQGSGFTNTMRVVYVAADSTVKQ